MRIGILAFLIFFTSFSIYSNDYSSLENQEVKDFIKQYSLEKKISEDKLKNIFSKVNIREKVKTSSKKENQAEFKLYWNNYKDKLVTYFRILKGKYFIEQNELTLARMETQYKVPREIVSAIIGIESNYGGTFGDYRAIDSLATMTFENNPRSKFFRSQMISFLDRCLSNKIDCFETKSSWAGAIGYGQFIPTSIDAYAVDFNKNGKIDLINEVEDAIGSVGNYLSKNGWENNSNIVIKATASSELYKELLTKGISLNTNIKELKEKGISGFSGISDDKKCRVFELESEDKTEIYIGFKNFKAITHYNKSNFYAMAVFELAKELGL